MDEQFISLKELTNHLSKVISYNMRDLIWVRCEVSSVSSNRGHYYLHLVEQEGQVQVAKINAVIWAKDANFLKKKFGDDTFDTLIDQGRETLLLVRVDYHSIYGMKLIVHDIDPRVTIGQLEMERIKTLERLTKEHLLDVNKRVYSPIVWQRIAVISSSSAAGYIDFVDQLQQNSFGYQFNVTLFNASMQGVHLETTVCEQIRSINEQAADFDVIVIVRGGGAKLDLVGFDQYQVCKEIAHSSLPVLVGIGHEIDHVLAEKVSNSFAKTPTAAAEFLIERMLIFEQKVLQYYDHIQKQLTHQFKKEELGIENAYQRIKFALRSAFKAHQLQLESYERIVSLLDPHKILDRGYAAIVNEDGELIRSLSDLDKKNEFTIHLSDGNRKVSID